MWQQKLYSWVSDREWTMHCQTVVCIICSICNDFACLLFCLFCLFCPPAIPVLIGLTTRTNAKANDILRYNCFEPDVPEFNVMKKKFYNNVSGIACMHGDNRSVHEMTTRLLSKQYLVCDVCWLCCSTLCCRLVSPPT